LWSRDNGKTGHFARVNQKTKFNSLEKSNNVMYGKVYSFRVFREVKKGQ